MFYGWDRSHSNCRQRCSRLALTVWILTILCQQSARCEIPTGFGDLHSSGNSFSAELGYAVLCFFLSLSLSQLLQLLLHYPLLPEVKHIIAKPLGGYRYVGACLC